MDEKDKMDTNPSENEMYIAYADQIQGSVIASMSDGVMVIDFEGIIRYVNAMAAVILCMDEKTLLGEKFAKLFFLQSENDAFMEAVMDTIYEQSPRQTRIVPYHAADKTRQLRMTSSLFKDPGGKLAGMTILLSDLSELMELKDSLRAMEKINELNAQLNVRNELLSKTFGQFLSDEIVGELLDTPGGLEPGGKKRTVTIMMSDLRGFTAMSEHMDAGDLIDMLNHYLEVMTDAIQSRGGTIIEFIGDGIMAIFGAPRHQETHAANAVAAALEMQASMRSINKWNAKRNYPPLEMGIGLNCGEVIVGNIGSKKRMKYGVVGSHVNLCGRIESYTSGGQILISPGVREGVHTQLQIEKEMTVLPKGADGEIILSQVTGIGAPYDIQISMEDNRPEKLKSPIPVCFCQIDGKHTMDSVCYGGIVALGSDCAVLETATQMELYDNLQIDAGGRLLGKVTEKTDQTYLIRYTSIPSGYSRWVKSWQTKSGHSKDGRPTNE